MKFATVSVFAALVVAAFAHSTPSNVPSEDLTTEQDPDGGDDDLDLGDFDLEDLDDEEQSEDDKQPEATLTGEPLALELLALQLQLPPHLPRHLPRHLAPELLALQLPPQLPLQLLLQLPPQLPPHLPRPLLFNCSCPRIYQGTYQGTLLRSYLHCNCNPSHPRRQPTPMSKEKPFRLAYWSTPTHSQLTTAYYATSSYSAQSIAHLVVECEQVTGHRIQSGLVPAIQKSRLRLLGRALDPGVENVYTWLSSLGPDSRQPSDPFWLKLELGHFSLAHWYHGAVGKISALVLVSSDQTAIQEQILADTTSQTKDSQTTTLVCIEETLRTCGDSASLQKYVTRQLLDTSGFFKDPSFDQSRAHGTRYLMLARMDALWTARKAIQIGILVDTHPFSVDHCILCDQQLLSTSIAHLVVECEKVNGHRIQSGLVPAIQKSRLRLLGRALDPGVENVYTWLRGGVLNGEADLDQRWLDGTVEHESMGTRHDNRALAARNHGKGKPAPSGAFTHRIREDGEVFSSEEGRDTSSDTTPLASVAGSVRMRSTDSDRSVRATPKKARDVSPPPQDDLWVVVKNLSQQFAAQQDRAGYSE
ncbi:hypothetical protein BASA83_007360 [Batrachochytrium salamandrivorans]|nr:hypothetical protein BASA83_007360 [Batrachochytrium salamandrivorans]